MSRVITNQRGPFTADQLQTGDEYELSNGHPIQCSPAGGRHSGSNADGAAIIGSDPDVDSVGVDAGFSPEPGTLRAPDVAVGVSKEPGWTPGAPPLALEYADRGQDEDDLAGKIHDLLRAGTQWIWVIRLDGPHRVEIHTLDGMHLAHPGDELTAPGVLRNAVPVEALFDRQAAERVTLRNLLQRQGYADLNAVQAESRDLGVREGELKALRSTLLEACEAKDFQLTDDHRKLVHACEDPDRLQTWFRRSIRVATVNEVFD